MREYFKGTKLVCLGSRVPTTETAVSGQTYILIGGEKIRGIQ